jgi:hypothetical protein
MSFLWFLILGCKVSKLQSGKVAELKSGKVAEWQSSWFLKMVCPGVV